VRVTERVYPARRDPRWRDALCSFEGEFSFEISIPPDPDGSWILHLEGGGFCGVDGDGPGGCSFRERNRVSSSNLASDGTIETDTPAPGAGFERATRVQAHYCSNDLWTGTVVDGPEIEYGGTRRPWSFTGHRNVSAMLDVLVERYGLDDADPDLAILASGNSAGGWGTLNQAWHYAERFPTSASRGNLLVYSSAGFVPYQQGPIADGLAIVVDAWRSALAPRCVADRPHAPAACITGSMLYDYITGPEPAGLDLPVFIYQNRQDQVYMNQAELPRVSPSSTDDELAARQAWVAGMNVAMGIDLGVPTASSRIRWLHAPSDPQQTRTNGSPEPNVHPPGCYDNAPPDGAAHGVSAVLTRFWAQRGAGAGRGRAAGEVNIYDVNWVTGACP
jgi:hypothetical protein